MVYTSKNLTKVVAEQLVAKHGGKLQAARAIVNDCRAEDGRNLSVVAVETMLRRACNGALVADKPAILQPAEADKLNQIKNALDEAGIPIDQIGKISMVKVKSGFHEGLTKSAEGDPVITKLRSKNVEVSLSPKWEGGPEWPLIQRADPVIIKYAAPTIIVPRGLRTEIVYPDTQFGYQRVLETVTFDGKTETCEHETIHSEESIDVALQITAAVQPDGLTHVGDLMDDTEFSRYIQTAEFYGTTQKSLDRSHRFLVEAKSAAGPPKRRRGQKKTTPKEFRLVDGNHDNRRLAVYIQQNARAAYGLRRADTTPDSWAVNTTPYLLRLDEIGWDFCGTWPHSEAWLVKGKNALGVIHDPRVGYYEASIMAGHSHHHKEESFCKRNDFGGFREYTYYQIGCLCNRGPVKSKSAINRSATPSAGAFAKDWVHGIAVVEILDDTGQHQVEFVKITDGVAIYQGGVFKSTSDKATLCEVG